MFRLYVTNVGIRRLIGRLAYFDHQIMMYLCINLVMWSSVIFLKVYWAFLDFSIYSYFDQLHIARMLSEQPGMMQYICIVFVYVVEIYALKKTLYFIDMMKVW